MKECVEKVAPVANRVLIFTTDFDSFHGHPEPIGARRVSPAGRWRCTTSASRTTRWSARPSTGADRGTGLHCDHRSSRQADPPGLRLGETSLGTFGRLRPQGPRKDRQVPTEGTSRVHDGDIGTTTGAAGTVAGGSRRVTTAGGTDAAARRRFTIAVLVGVAVVAIPYLWVMCDQWTGSLTPFRAVAPANFYELQARAMFQGHLYIPDNTIGIEAFKHGGHQYTYFGLFPSLIRMPILAVTHGMDGKLTGPSMFIAWLTTAVFSSALLWRIRIIAVGEAVVTRAEAISYGILMASIMGGSVLIFLGANPFVYNEDFAWSVALTTGSIFALLGVLERPSWWRVGGSGLLVLCAP